MKIKSSISNTICFTYGAPFHIMALWTEHRAQACT